MATTEDNGVSADLAGYDDPDSFEAAHWRKVETEALILCAPLAQMLEPKRVCGALDKSRGQLSRELSPHYENGLGLLTALCIGRATRNDKLARVIVCEGLGMTFPEWQRQKATPEERLRALEEECRASGAAGLAIIEGAKKRARSRR